MTDRPGGGEDWRPIDSAPRGPILLGYDPQWGVCEILRSHQMNEWGVAAFNGQIIKCDPSHWMPLPQPPRALTKATDTAGGGK